LTLFELDDFERVGEDGWEEEEERKESGGEFGLHV
jgi:hypothetical protein